MGGSGSKNPTAPTAPPPTAIAQPEKVKPPTENPDDSPEAKKAAEELKKQEQLAAGRASTNKTGGLLDSGEDKTKKKTLLGE